MFCSKCGAKNDAGTRFCPSCGASMGGQHPVQAHIPATRQSSQAYRYPTSPPGEHRQTSLGISNKNVGIIACAVVLLAIVIGAIIIITPGGSHDRAVVGKWEVVESLFSSSGTFLYEFRRNGRGTTSSEFSYDRDVILEEEEFTWGSDKDGRIWMQFGESDIYKIWFSYKVAGDTMRLEDDNECIIILRRVK